MEKYDFSGWATRNNILCDDGRTIAKNAFAECDGQTVPLVWGHIHDDPERVLGHAALENRDDGVYAYCTFNDTEGGVVAKALVNHGDIRSLSIYANKLQHSANNVVTHGVIREVSLVHASANPGAYIDTILSHSADSSEGEAAMIYNDAELELYHSADNETKDEKEKEKEKEKGGAQMAEDKTKTANPAEEEETLEDVFNTLSEKQKNAVYAMIGLALEDEGGDDEDDDNDEGGKSTMKHNAFDNEQPGTVLSHAAMKQIFADGKRLGSLKDAVEQAYENGVLQHASYGPGVPTTGMDVATGTSTYGFNDPDMLFPDYKSLDTPPSWITRRREWVTEVMNTVHHTPFSRVKSVHADLTADDARALGYVKGNLKKEEVFALLRRTTDPQTIYKKQKMDRDDIIDITDFDVVAWIKSEMRHMLDEEIARAILLGDGRSVASNDKISELHIRPVVTDAPLYNTTTKVTVDADATDADIAKAVIDAAVRARKSYKGKGNPTFFTTIDTLTEMLLLEDGIGHKLYKSKEELATAMMVSKIVTVEPMEGMDITIGNDDFPLIGTIVNLSDYNVGADKGGAVSMFEDFDIDYNQEKYLIETRISGALTTPFAAITLVLDQAE